MSPDDRGRDRLRVDSPAAVIAVIPYLFGFTPEDSLVVLGADAASRRIRLPALRYDLPDPPDPATATAITTHAVTVLTGQQADVAVVVGYGPGRLVTPLADAVATAVPAAGIRLHDLLRADEGRYWSYLCRNPGCCPPDGVPIATVNTVSPALAAVLDRLGRPAASRADLAAGLAPVTGPAADTARTATRRAEDTARRLIACPGRRALVSHGIDTVKAAIGAYRGGEPISADRVRSPGRSRASRSSSA